MWLGQMLPKGVQRQITGLNAISNAQLAVKLPKNVKKVELTMPRRVTASNIGAKQFWRGYLPPIQFYNPQIPITVNRLEQMAKSELIVSFVDGSSKSVAADGRKDAEILADLQELVKGEPVTPVVIEA